MSAWNIDRELYDLPEDPGLSFVHLEKKARDKLDEAIHQAEMDDHAVSTRYERDYMSTVLGYANALEIEELLGWELPGSGDRQASEICNNFLQDATRVSATLLIQGVRRAKPFSVSFDQATKERLRFHLEQIRQTVDKADISAAKKERIYKRISDLQFEINKDRTRIEMLTALAIETATGLNNAAKPILETIERVHSVFGESKELEEVRQARLPAPARPKQIPSQKQKPKPLPKHGFEKDLDDEIPF